MPRKRLFVDLKEKKQTKQNNVSPTTLNGFDLSYGFQISIGRVNLKVNPFHDHAPLVSLHFSKCNPLVSPEPLGMLIKGVN